MSTSGETVFGPWTRSVLAALGAAALVLTGAVDRPARPSAAGLNHTRLSSTHFYGQVRVTPTNQVYWYDVAPR